MIYLVTGNQELFDREEYKIISVKESLDIMKDWKIVQFDTETSGRDAHLCNLLSMQFGSSDGKTQIVVDCSTTDPKKYKKILESKLIIGQHLKFDLQFLFNYNIIPCRIYDTMIVEQLLHLGYPNSVISYSLKSIAEKRLKVEIDKSVRGEIIWRGLDSTVVIYAAGDVKYLYDIMMSQWQDCIKQGCTKGAKLECAAVIPIAYMEWCGIHLDANKWKAKMKKDKVNLDESKKALDDFIIKLSEEGFKQPYKDDAGNTFYNTIPAQEFKKYVFIDRQGDLFMGYNLKPQVKINWSSSQQVVKIAKLLGFNTTVQDKKTGEDKDSVLEKQLKGQKGICDEFLNLYFAYQGYSKVVTSFGQGHLNAINPVTHRIHTTFKQLGASSGRMSCGSQQPNTDLAKINKVRPQDCTFPNLQQLPSDEETRAAFTAEKGNMYVSCDFSAEESRLGADIYDDTEFRKEFTERTGDTHSMFAWAVFKNECKQCGCKSAADVKKLAPQWRKKVKAVEFAYMFGAAAPTISQSADCTVEEAQGYIDTLNKEFSGISTFADKGSKFVRSHGYIVINPITGHKLYWWDWKQWKEESLKWDRDFWNDYKAYHKGTGDEIAQKVRHHFQVAGKYDRLARNVVTQGTGAIILKTALIKLFKWIVCNNYFNKVKICVCVHDEINCEYPKELVEFPNILENIMESSAAMYCKSLPIPAEAEVSTCWVH